MTVAGLRFGQSAAVDDGHTYLACDGSKPYKLFDGGEEVFCTSVLYSEDFHIYQRNAAIGIVKLNDKARDDSQ